MRLPLHSAGARITLGPGAHLACARQPRHHGSVHNGCQRRPRNHGTPQGAMQWSTAQHRNTSPNRKLSEE